MERQEPKGSSRINEGLLASALNLLFLRAALCLDRNLYEHHDFAALPEEGLSQMWGGAFSPLTLTALPVLEQKRVFFSALLILFSFASRNGPTPESSFFL